MFVCSANSVTSLLDVTGFSLTLGRKDLQRASDTASGQCLTTFFDSSMEDVARPESQNAISDGANRILAEGGQAAAYKSIAGGKAAGKIVNKVASKIMGRISSFQRNIPMHFLDSIITWMMGVVSGLQVVTCPLLPCSSPDFF